MIIRSQHKWKDSDFTPQCAWGEKDTVQWGSSGIVLCRTGNYQTAFFEAFPDEAAYGNRVGGFIRGEGKTISEAEAAAFAQLQRQLQCDHIWGREKYKNGGTLCRHCRAFKTTQKPIFEVGKWRKPLSGSEQMMIDMVEETLSLPDDDPWKRPVDEDELKRHRLYKIRKRIYGTI